MSASCDSVSQKRTVTSVFAGRVLKRPKQGDGQKLQEAALRLLDHHHSLKNLLLENPKTCNISSGGKAVGEVSSQGIPSAITGSLLVCELRRQAKQQGVPLIILTVTTLLQRLKEVTETKEENERPLLTASRRAQLCILLEHCHELLSQGVLCPKLLWHESTRDQKFPKLEVVFYLHSYNIVTLKYILESEKGVKAWLVSELKALCSWTPPHDEAEATQVQHRVLTTVLEVLVGTGFELREESVSPDRRLSQLCSSILDHILFWILETVEQDETGSTAGTGAQLWTELFDTSLCGALVSAEVLQRCFTHYLTSTLTYKPRLTVSDAITLQNKWTFAKSNRLLTSLFYQLAVVFSVEQLLHHLQQVLSTHEVNWQHVLCFLSTLLVYNPSVQTSLTELLSRLLSTAFESYDFESVTTAFLLTRQGALEGPAIFPSYSAWFKKSFGGGSSHHARSKKALVFLLKFLSDLVPFEPPQYLKVHILHPPYVPIKHRSLLMEYISLAKTRLADLKESVEDMGLYEDVSGAEPAAQPLCQVVSDVEKAVSLFASTGRISATVMEASIFRQPYFLSRFLPALLEPRVLPASPDACMSFIEALKKADKISAARYAMYVESCQRQRQQDQNAVSVNTSDSPVDVLRVQLQEFRELALTGNEADMSAQLSRISHTLGVIFPAQANELNTSVIVLHTARPLSSELHVQVVNMILRNFCQSVLDVSRTNPPNKQIVWASRFAIELVGNRPLFSSLLHRLWDLFHNQMSSLTQAHVPGLAAFMVHLQASMSHIPLIQLHPPILPKPASVTEILSSALICNTHTNMLFCVRFCVAAVCYGMCRGDWIQHKQLQYIPSSVYKKLLYLIPRLLSEARRTPGDGPMDEFQGNNVPIEWTHASDCNFSWRRTALSLWSHPAFQDLRHRPQYQLQFSEWLHNELRVQRSEDALSEAERQEYQQWAIMELYLPLSEEQGGCGGDTRNLCSVLINAIMDLQQGEPRIVEKHHGATEYFLPDILSRLQECVYEMSVAGISRGCTDKADVGHFLFELISKRVTSSVPLALCSISTEVHLQHTLHTWNRLLLALPAALFIQLKSEGGRPTLDCSLLIEHVNQHQRLVCCPAGLLPCHLTTHFLKGVLYASVCCGQPTEEVNKAWSQISLHCPLLLVSTAHWWEHVYVVMLSLWSRLCNELPLPEQLQLLSDCHVWARRGLKGQVTPMPPAPSLQLAACLYRASQDCGWANNSYSSVLLRDQQNQQVMVFLLFLCVNRSLSSQLYPQEKCQQTVETCTALLHELVDSSDWLSIFKSNEQGIYQQVVMVTSDEYTRLMPWAFYSLMCQQSTELLHRAACCPGFVHTAVVCYSSLLRLFLDGHTSDSNSHQVDPSQILSQSKGLLLKTISQMSRRVLSSSQLRQLQDHCADLDPEVTAALMVHQDLDNLSPAMDFV